MKKFGLLGACAFALTVLSVAITPVAITPVAHASSKCDRIVKNFDPSDKIPYKQKVCVDNAEGRKRCGGSSKYYRRVIGGSYQLGIQRVYDCVRK